MVTVRAFCFGLCCLLILACTEQGTPAKQGTASTIRVEDFLGNIIELEKPAEKIVALAPHVVENIYSAGAGDRIVAAVEHSDFPAQAKQLPTVGGYEKTNIEAIISLDPDLIVGWDTGNSHAAITRLKELGYTVYIDQPDSLFDVAKSIRDLGTLTGNQETAEAVARNYLDTLSAMTDKYRDKAKVTSFYQVWNSPLRTISGNHIISNTIEICGGTNIYADEFAVAPVINIESVIERNPDAIIASGMGAARPSWLDDWKKWPSLTAVQHDNLIFVNPDHIQRHTVRLLLGLESVCRQLDEVRARLADSQP